MLGVIASISCSRQMSASGEYCTANLDKPLSDYTDGNHAAKGGADAVHDSLPRGSQTPGRLFTRLSLQLNIDD